MNSLQKKLVLNTLVLLAREALEHHGDNITADRLKIAVLRLFLSLVGDTDFHQYVTGWDTLQKHSEPPTTGAANDDVVTIPADDEFEPLDWTNFRRFVKDGSPLVERPWSPAETAALNSLFNTVIPKYNLGQPLKTDSDPAKVE